MYLEGQLPYGPDSLNLGGQPTPGGNSALDGQPVISAPPDTSQPAFFTVPEGGDVVVSPSLANADGVVQVPYTAPQSSPLGQPSGYSDCGSYGTTNFMATIKHRAGRAAGLGSMCQSGPQSVQQYSQADSPWPLFLGLGLIAIVLGSSNQ